MRIVYISNGMTCKNVNKILEESLKQIALKKNHEVYFIGDYNNTEIHNYSEFNIKTIHMDDCDLSKFNGAIFVASISMYFILLYALKNTKQYKLCLCCEDETSIDLLNEQCKLIGIRFEYIIDLLKKTHSIFFVDDCIRKRIEERYDIPQSLVLPYRILNYDSMLISPQPVVSNDINIGFLGDISVEFLNAVTSICNEILQHVNYAVEKRHSENSIYHQWYSNMPNINVHLITKDNRVWKIDFSKYASIIKFILPGELNNSCEDYIRGNIDFLITYDDNVMKSYVYGIPILIPVMDVNYIYPNPLTLFFDLNSSTMRWNAVDFANVDVNRTYSICEVIDEIYVNQKKESWVRYGMLHAYNKLNDGQVSQIFEQIIEISNLTQETIFTNTLFNNQINVINDAFEPMNLNQSINYVNKALSFSSDYKKNNPFNKIRNRMAELYTRHKYYKIQKSYKRKEANIRAEYMKHGVIKVAFVITYKSVFPTQSVFEKMLHMNCFDPYIIVAPVVDRSMRYQMDNMNDAFDFYDALYPERVIKGYHYDTITYYDMASQYKVIFFANPYKHQVHKIHYIDYFCNKDVLPIYVNYGFAALNFWDEVISTDFFNYAWKVCLETEDNYEYLKKNGKIKGLNGAVTGYIKMDALDEIRNEERKRKSVLICPHHTVWGWKTLNISNFLRFSDLFLELPRKYPDIDFILRPHPLLFTNLVDHNIWGQEQIDNYLNQISQIDNLYYDNSGNYLDKFVSSDAMIHDCGSFIGEYLYTEKPCCYMMKSKDETYSKLLPLGQKCMDNYYHALNESDIYDFIENVVIKENDPLKKTRIEFSREVLKKNYPYAAQAVINLILDVIKCD